MSAADRAKALRLIEERRLVLRRQDDGTYRQHIAWRQEREYFPRWDLLRVMRDRGEIKDFLGQMKKREPEVVVEVVT